VKPTGKDNFDKRCDKMCEVMETLVKNIAAVSTSVKTLLRAQMQAHLPPTCYKCGVVGHLSNQCKGEIDEKKASPTVGKVPFKCYKCGGYGHIARNCPDNKNKNNEKNNEKLPAEKVTGIKGTEDRSMKEHPVYIKAQIGRHMAVCLVDTGSEKCVLPKRMINEAQLEPAECRLFAANRTTINMVGEKTLNVHVGDLTIPTRFVISNNVTEPMLGVN